MNKKGSDFRLRCFGFEFGSDPMTMTMTVTTMVRVKNKQNDGWQQLICDRRIRTNKYQCARWQ